MSSLCSRCRKIKLAILLVDHAPFIRRRASFFLSGESVRNNDCDYCRMFLSSLSTDARATQDQRHFLSIDLNTFNPAEERDPCIRRLLSVSPMPKHKRSVLSLLSDDPETGVFYLSKLFPVRYTVPGNAISPFVATSLLKAWLKRAGVTCEDGLIKDRSQTKTRKELPSLTVIDCKHELLKIVPLPPEEHYLTLSYVWGNPQDNEDEAVSNDTLPGRLPQTIQDTVVVTKSLGFRFLWIDRYCIPQTDGEIKSRLIASMGSIYSNSSLTLVAQVGRDPHHGLTGISRSRVPTPCINGYQLFPSDSAESNVWATRGWTFQEGLLSRRSLYFTDYQVIFQSKEFVEYELPTNSNGDDKNLIDTSFPSHENASKIYPIRAVLRCIAFYTKRKMSRPEIDRLRALYGIFSAYNIRHLWGLPFDYASANSNLPFAPSLCWESIPTYSPSPMVRYKGFPTWSWASYPGPVEWGLDWLENPHSVQPLIEMKGVELATGNIISWEGYRARCQVMDHDTDTLDKFIHIFANSTFSLDFRKYDSRELDRRKVKTVVSGGHAFNQGITIKIDLLETALATTDVLLGVDVGVPTNDANTISRILVLRDKDDFWERIGLAEVKRTDVEQWKTEPKNLRLG